MSGDGRPAMVADHGLSVTDRWDEVERLFGEIGEHLEAIRSDAPDWLKLAFVNHAERVEAARRKLSTLHTVVAGE